ncbi:hypothetical protein EDD41_2822 [Luteococcus japonicus]|uniref:Uncharacterized protein n=2 Tax=Luteococcus japonicus TaxID=33984 RepID=A0A1R4KN25_9ACTN|nr:MULTISPECIES: hypothetical protein [Luteococcus]MDN5563253.1 hypothetical protein [Luteococcus sp.]ROR55545.1 hypothetical protein EDD41_2822 [Luteococcus japonicus]SJN45642.1 hypothetical protein FM114_16200 [Luteococcus japonicus LSP_Lj1]
MSRRAWAHVLLALAGLALALFGAWSATHPDVTCRGVQMHPGDVCHKNDFGAMGTDEVQTYEQRMHAARLSQPVLIVAGLVVAGFGTALAVADRRRTAAAGA